ncbi:BZ3501_MvSof-1269-A2-R1_Chr12-2g03462 [Microbotryum saponariae]|nr:BZ3501_MvSof-1269-A2-R1_Chr12-2g03462 [Microbotryum saponariae]
MLWNARLVDSAETSRTQTERPLSLDPFDDRLGTYHKWLPASKTVRLNKDRRLSCLTPSQTQHSNLLFLSHPSLALSIGYAMFTYRTNLGRPNTRDGSVHQHVCVHLILPMPSPVSLLEKDPPDSGGAGHGELFE